MTILRRFTIFLCLTAMASAATPRPLADVKIPTPDGKAINLRQYRGKVMIVTLFETTCADCIKTLDVLNAIQKEFGPRGLQVLAAAVNGNAAYLVEPFVQRYRPAYPIGFLDEESTMKLGDFTRDTHPFVPIVMFVDRAGTVQAQYFGNDPALKQQEKTFRTNAENLLKFFPKPAAKKAAAVSKQQ